MISSYEDYRLAAGYQRFNLGIEVLLISSSDSDRRIRMIPDKFQSRNRGSFDFKANIDPDDLIGTGFQSRNRGSFDFKMYPQVVH